MSDGCLFFYTFGFVLWTVGGMRCNPKHPIFCISELCAQGTAQLSYETFNKLCIGETSGTYPWTRSSNRSATIDEDHDDHVLNHLKQLLDNAVDNITTPTEAILNRYVCSRDREIVMGQMVNSLLCCLVCWVLASLFQMLLFEFWVQTASISFSNVFAALL